MTVLCDFSTIIGDNAQTVPVAGAGAEVPLGNVFGAGGRIASGSETGSEAALLIYSVRGMVGTAQVFVNDSTDVVGTITPSSGTAWSTQMIAIAGSRLTSTANNRIRLRNV